MEPLELKATTRTVSGKGAARSLRREAQIPAVLYGPKTAPVLLSIQLKDFEQLQEEYSSAQGLLLDSYKKGVPGGTGETFNWDKVPQNLELPVILAGGLSPENIGRAISEVRPYAVDVSGGVESSKGIKDTVKIAEFIRQTYVLQ